MNLPDCYACWVAQRGGAPCNHVDVSAPVAPHLIGTGKTTMNAALMRWEIRKTLSPEGRARMDALEQAIEQHEERTDVDVKKILIIDDEAPYRELLSEILAEAGFVVCCAENGLLGLKALTEHRPSLVLLDIIMPVMDGREFLERARDHELSELRNVPIWIVSATTPSRTASTFHADGFLIKNINLGREVLALAERYCGAAVPA